ncbi:MAG TPA: prepilin-type N-terminal cleavage/methylation domain-containing protein [Myxococcota bacterium]|nr:prepilin-type N-terminal cleavage/methylation domain-containing protein [Myxococcota bacterium]
MSKRDRPTGFTLVEVMIAVAIIGVLAALSTTNYQIYIERVRVARAVVEMRGLSLHLQTILINGGTLPPTLASVQLSQADPWGRMYVYRRISGAPPFLVRKDQFLVPLNTDFDLYSLGADGQSQPPVTHPLSLDDVVRGANGAFIGLARNY